MTAKSKLTTRKIVFTAMMAALTCVCSALRITMPLSIAGNTSFHLGNIMCALSGILLGPWLGGLASGLGSMIYDLFNPAYAAECWITFLTKGVYGLLAGAIVFGAGKSWKLYVKALVGSALGAVAYAVLYLLKSYIKAVTVGGLTAQGGMLTVTGKLPATIFNAAVAIIFAPMLAVALRKALERAHLTLE